MAGEVKVLVIDDHPLVADGCLRICEGRPDLQVHAANSAEAGFAASLDLRPDVILLDMALPDLGGLESLKRLLQDRPGAKVVILSMHDEPAAVASALAAGASGYVSKNDGSAAVLAAVDRARTGQLYLSQSVGQSLAVDQLRSSSADATNKLTDRERKMMALLGEGRSLTEISHEIGLNYKTVANSVSLIRQKLKFATMSALIKFAVEQKLKRGA